MLKALPPSAIAVASAAMIFWVTVAVAVTVAVLWSALDSWLAGLRTAWPYRTEHNTY